MKLREYPTSTIIGMNDDDKQLLKLFVSINGTTISKLTNQLYQQYFINELEVFEDDFPDKQNDWNNIRELLHK